MLSVASAALSFNAPLVHSGAAAARSSSAVMQEKSQAIPFLKKPPALDGAPDGFCTPQAHLAAAAAHRLISDRLPLGHLRQVRWLATLASTPSRSPTLSHSSGLVR